jgi:dihydrofolate reductase
MSKLVVGTFVTLDGVMQAPGGADEDRDGGFEHGGWLVPYFDEEFLGIMTEWTKRAGAFLLGRKTYEIFAASWPRSTDPADEIATALNTRPKFVASRTLDEATWNNTHLIKGDAAEEVAKLKAQDGGEIQVHGSGNFFKTLLARDLIDTLRIKGVATIRLPNRQLRRVELHWYEAHGVGRRDFKIKAYLVQS